MANFRTRARAVDLLGKQQIRDEVTAISELLRNSYDADASIGVVDVDTSQDRIIIWDDGEGMTEDSILNNWLTLGTYSKKSKLIKKTKKGRVKIGEKGIGRLAISLLGEQLFLLTKNKISEENPASKWTLLYLHWALFRNENLYLEEINIPVIEFENFNAMEYYLKNNLDQVKLTLLRNFENRNLWIEKDYEKIVLEIKNFDVGNDIFLAARKIERNEGGCLFYISNIESQWDWKIYNSRTKPENLKSKHQRLKDLLFSFQNFIDIFDEQIKEDNLIEEDNNKFIPKIIIDKENQINDNILTANEVGLYDYALKGEIRNNEFFGDAYMGNENYFEKVVVEKSKLTSGITSILDCGPIKIKWFFVEGKSNVSSIPPDLHKNITNKLDEIGGIFVFRDGLRILPYGEVDNDFLNVEKRRTIRAGTYLFSFRRMYGYVEINKENNPELIDKSSREGFIENAHFNQFKIMLSNLLIWWARDYLESDDKEGKRQKFIKEQGEKTKFESQRELEKQEEKKYFLKLNNWTRNFQNNKDRKNKEIELKIEKNLREIENSIEKGEISESSIIKKKIELQEVINSLEELQWHEILRYEHLPQEKENLQYCNEELKELKTKKITVLNNKIEDYIESLRLVEQFIDKNNNESILKELSSMIQFLNENYQPNLKNIENISEHKIKVILNDIVSKINDEIRIELNNTKMDLSMEKLEKEVNEVVKELVNLKSKIVENTENEYIEIYNKLLEQYNNVTKKVRKNLTEYQYSLENSKTLNELEYRLGKIKLSFHDRDQWNYDDSLIGKLKQELTTYRDLSALGLATELTDHEFNSLYSKIKENLNSLSKALKNTRALPMLNNTINGFKSLEKLHERMSPLYRQSRNKKNNINLKDYVNTILEFFNSDFSRFDIEVYNKIPSDFYVYEAEVTFFTPLVNIISNSIYWLLNSDKKELHFYLSDDQTQLYIHDSGVGIDDKDHQRIFEPFFSKKIDGRGLGLFLSKDILLSKGHDLILVKSPNYLLTGACFSIIFNNNSIIGEY